MIVDGRALAEKRIQELLALRQQFGELTLGIVVSQRDAVTESFIRIKKKAAAALGVGVVECANLDEAAQYDGVILQLPLPQGIDVDIERSKIPTDKDVDVLSDAAYTKFVAGTYPPPPVPRAMEYILKMYDISYSGKKVLVVGQGRLVGLPAAELMRQRGAQVTVATRGDDIGTLAKDADIIILGAGEPGLLTPEMIKDGVVILDAGTSEAAGKVVGDADPACAAKASLFTPVPGGIGPLAVVEIFANLFELKKNSQ